MNYNFDINNALTNANQFGQVQGNEPKEFNPTDAVNLFKNSLQNVSSAESKMGSIPAVYGDSQMNLTFDRYYMHPNYDSLGFSPWRDNDTMYNANSSWYENLGRSTKAMGSIAMESFGSNKPFISTLDLFDPLNYDEESAGEISRLMKLGYDTSGGLGGFVNNFVLNTGITLGIAGSALIEEAGISAISGAVASSGVGAPAGVSTFLAGTALNIAKLGKRLGQVIDANKLLLNVTKNADELKSIYNFSKLAKKMDSSAVVDFFNPLSSTTKLLSEYPETFKGLNALGKTSMTFGAFYKDARRSARILNEAQLEGGLVVNQMVEDAIRKEYDLTGQYPSEEKIQAFTDNARQAAFVTTMINLPLIHFSDKVGLDNILAKLPKGKNLLKNLDEVTPFGDFVKQKGVGYKHIDSNWQKLTTSMKPVTLGKNFLNYARYNFSEAIQENLQEATSSGVINYYEKLFNNPTIDQNELLRQSISKGLGEQFTAQGLETFASGFLTGGLIGGLGKAAGFGMNSFQQLYDKKGWDEYVTKRNEFIKQAEESLNILDKSFLDLGAGMGDIFNPNAVNAAQQSGTSRVIKGATEGNNVKLQKDAQRLALFEHVYNAIKIGKFNTVVDSYKEMLNMDDKTFAEAFNIDLTEVGNTRSKVSKSIKQAEGIKDRFDKYNFQNPVNLNGVSKDDPNYSKLVAKRNAIETVKKILIMSEDSVADGVNRLQSITQSITNILPEFGEIDSDDILSFIDPHRLDAYKLKQLDREIQLQKETSTLPGISAEDKKTAEDKLKYLIQKKSSIVEVANKLTNFRNKLSNNEEFTDSEREELTAAFKAHLDVLNTNPETRSTNYSTEAVDEALEYITDYAKLEAENNVLTSVISVLQNPEGFAKTVDDTTTYLEGVLQNTQMYANMLNRAISLNELNAMYNYMFNNHGVFVIETEEGKYYFAKPGPNANDPFIILSETDDDFNKIEDDYLEFKEKILKNEELEKLKVKKEAVKKKRDELESTLDKIRKLLKRNKKLTDEEIEEQLELIKKNPFTLALYSKMMLDVVKAQDIEDATDTSPSTVEEALDALSALELASFKLTDDNKNYVQIDPETGEFVDPEFLWDRVTSLFKTEEDKRQIEESSTHRGNIMDGLLRLMIDNPNVSQEEFDAEYESLKANNGKAPKFNKQNLTSLKAIYTSLIEEAAKKKWTLKANIPTLWGEINGKKVAGTIDIIAIKENGDVIIIDLKTSKFNRQNQYNIEDDLKTMAGPLYDSIKEKIKKNSNKLEGASFTEEEQKVIDSFQKKHNVKSIFFYKDSDVQQLSAYAELLRQRTGINVKTLAISPFIVKTDKLGTNITDVSRISTIIVNRSTGPKFESKPPAAGAQPGSGSTDALGDIERRKKESLNSIVESYDKGTDLTIGKAIITKADGTKESISDLKDVVTTGDPFQRLKDKIEAIYKQELDALEGTALQKGEKGKNETLTEDEELIEEEPLTEEEIKLRDERVELINKTIGLLEKRKEKGIQSITNVENTLEYLNDLLNETSELGFEEVKKILNAIKTLENAISSNSARKSKRGQNIILSIEEYKKQFRTEKQLFNDIANRIKYLKEDLQQLKQIDKDLSDQINYYRNMIVDKNFKNLSFEEIKEKIDTINKKKSVLEKIINALLNVIKQSVFYLKEYVKITTKSINDLEIFKKNTNFKRLNTEELRKLIDAEDFSATTEYDKLRQQADKLEKDIENNLDSIEIVEGAKQKEQERLDDLYNVIQKYNNQLRYLNNLLSVLYPDLTKTKLEKATEGKAKKETVPSGTKKAPTPTAKPNPEKTETRLEDAKKEKAKAQKRTAKPKKVKPVPVVADKKAEETTLEKYTQADIDRIADSFEPDDNFKSPVDAWGIFTTSDGKAIKPTIYVEIKGNNYTKEKLLDIEDPENPAVQETLNEIDRLQKLLDVELAALGKPTADAKGDIKGQVGTSNYSVEEGLIFYNKPDGTMIPVANPKGKPIMEVIVDDIERRRQEAESKITPIDIDVVDKSGNKTGEVRIKEYATIYGEKRLAAKTEEELKKLIQVEYNAELAALEGTTDEEKTEVVVKTSKIDVTKILDNGVMMYPIYKNNVLQGYVSYSQIEKSFNFFTPNKKLNTNKKISSAFLKDNPDLFKYWFENLLDDGDRENLKKQYFEYLAAKEIGNETDIKENIERYGIPISEFTKNEELLKIENRELPEEYAGKLIYGTPGIGKTFFVESYNGKYEVIDVDKLLLDRLEELNAESNFTEGLEFTNENLVSIIAKLYESVGFNDTEVNTILYAPVLQLIDNKKKEGAILFTGTKRFIKESDIAIIAKDRTEVLSTKIGTDINQIKDYQKEENNYIRNNKGKIILLDEGVYLNDVIYSNLEETSNKNAEAIFKKRLLNLLISDPENFSLYLQTITDFEARAKTGNETPTVEETKFYGVVNNYLNSNYPKEVSISSTEIFKELQNYYQNLQNKLFSNLEPIMKKIILNDYQGTLHFMNSAAELFSVERTGTIITGTLSENGREVNMQMDLNEFEAFLKNGNYTIIYAPKTSTEEFKNQVKVDVFDNIEPIDENDLFNQC